MHNRQEQTLTSLLLKRQFGPCRKPYCSRDISQQSSRVIDSWAEGDSLKRCSATYCQLTPPPRSTIAAAFSPDGKLVASTHGDHTVKVICVRTGKCLQILTGHRRTPWVVRFHPSSSSLLASGSLDYEVRLWNAHTAECINVHNFGRPIASLAFHIEGDALAVASGHKLYMWQYTRQQQGEEGAPAVALKTRRSLRAVHFHPLGLPLVLTAEVNDVSAPVTLPHGHPPPPTPQASAPLPRSAGYQGPVHADLPRQLSVEAAGISQDHTSSHAQQDDDDWPIQRPPHRRLSEVFRALMQEEREEELLAQLESQLRPRSRPRSFHPLRHSIAGDALASSSTPIMQQMSTPFDNPDVGSHPSASSSGMPDAASTEQDSGRENPIQQRAQAWAQQRQRESSVLSQHDSTHDWSPYQSPRRLSRRQSEPSRSGEDEWPALGTPPVTLHLPLTSPRRLPAPSPGNPPGQSTGSATTTSWQTNGQASGRSMPRVSPSQPPSEGSQIGFPTQQELQALQSTLERQSSASAAASVSSAPAGSLLASASAAPAVSALTLGPTSLDGQSRRQIQPPSGSTTPSGRRSSADLAQGSLSNAPQPIPVLTQAATAPRQARGAQAAVGTQTGLHVGTQLGAQSSPAPAALGFMTWPAQLAADPQGMAALPPSMLNMGWEYPAQLLQGPDPEPAARHRVARDDAGQQPNHVVAVRASAAAANIIGTEQPCRVRLRLWHCCAADPTAALEVPSLTIPDAVLCSEMGVHFSACGRYLAACVACQAGHLHDLIPDAAGIIYEVRVYSLEAASLGHVLHAKQIRAAHCLTSVQFSPTSEHLLLAYGRRHISLLRSLVPDGTSSIIPVHTILEVYRVSDMSLVRVLPSAEDEVNAAAFHPHAGEGLAYGTKEGKLRILRHDPRPEARTLATCQQPRGLEDELREAESIYEDDIVM
ncbi:hypothetical protein WJX79_000182 [Trebouxia sp. C0005]